MCVGGGGGGAMTHHYAHPQGGSGDNEVFAWSCTLSCDLNRPIITCKIIVM